MWKVARSSVWNQNLTLKFCLEPEPIPLVRSGTRTLLWAPPRFCLEPEPVSQVLSATRTRFWAPPRFCLEPEPMSDLLSGSAWNQNPALGSEVMSGSRTHLWALSGSFLNKNQPLGSIVLCLTRNDLWALRFCLVPGLVLDKWRHMQLVCGSDSLLSSWSSSSPCDDLSDPTNFYLIH